MTDGNVVPLTDDYLDAAVELREVLKRKAELAEREAELKEIITKALAEGETGLDPETGEALVVVKRGARVWNEAAALQALPAHLVEALTVTETKLDKDKAKAVLAPALYEKCCKANKPSVTLA